MTAPFKVCPQCGTVYPPNSRFCETDGTALRSATGNGDDLVGTVLVDRYHVLSKLGEGGSAMVYLAEHVKIGRKVALKVMHRRMTADVDAVSRFNREAANASRIAHPNVAAVYDFGETADGTIFIAMEYIEGSSLTRIIDDDGPLPPPLAAEIVRQTAEALTVAHKAGIVHRDLKPDNIMLARTDDGTTMVKVVDFGISKAAYDERQNVTKTGFVIGTPEYMSPEQFSGATMDGRSDIYALGLVAFRMLTATLPFPSDSAQESMIMRLTEKPKSLREMRPERAWSADLQAVMDKVLERDAGLRYRSAADFAQDLSAAIERMADPRPRSPAAGGISVTGRYPAPTAAVAGGASAPRKTVLTGRVLSVIAAGAVLVVAFVFVAQISQPWPWRLILIAAAVVFVAVGGMLGLRAFSRGARETKARGEAGKLTPVSTPSAKPPLPPTRVDADDGSTRVLDLGWGPPAPATKEVASESASSVTAIFAAPGEGAALKEFPVALTVISSAHPAQIGMRVRCDHFPFSVGRAPTSDLCIQDDDTLSRAHVVIDLDDTGFIVRDVSVNGVYVAGRHLHGASESLRIGTTIALSRMTALKFIADVPMLPDLSGQVLNDHYRLRQRIHNSLKSATYVASDERIPRSVAVKIFSPSLMKLASYRAEFRRQAEMAAKLQHPHVCRVIDWGEADVPFDGRPARVSYLCTEYMAGGNLTKRLQVSEPPAATAIIDWIQKISSALQHAHDNGIVHSDLKPDCILFDTGDLPYLTDFALATDGAYSARAVVGSPDYLAPEQWAGQSASRRSDQYSLAVLAYVMLTGARPHEGQADPDVRARNFERGPTPAHEEARRRGRADVTRPLSDVLARAMSLEPSDRYDSIDAFNGALSQAFRSPHRRSENPRIFFSYHRATSAPWATHFSSVLRAQRGFSVFVDTQAADGAAQISDLLRKEIQDCDVFVCLLGPETLKSKWVTQEISNAAKFGKPMVPIFQEGFKPAEVDTRRNPSLRKLLNCPAVHLFDLHNVHVDHTINDLGEKIRSLLAPQT